MHNGMKVNIVVHQLDKPRWEFRSPDYKRNVHVVYRDGEHYDSVRLIGDDAKAPATAFVVTPRGALPEGSSEAATAMGAAGAAGLKGKAAGLDMGPGDPATGGGGGEDRFDPEGASEAEKLLLRSTIGFSLWEARDTLESAGGDVDLALEILIAQQESNRRAREDFMQEGLPNAAAADGQTHEGAAAGGGDTDGDEDRSRSEHATGEKHAALIDGWGSTDSLGLDLGIGFGARIETQGGTPAMSGLPSLPRSSASHCNTGVGSESLAG